MTQEDAINMSNEQAILILKPFMEAMRDQYGCPISDAYFALEKAINSLREPQWIPFSEKMPDEHEWIGTKRFGTTISDTILITFDVDGERFVKPMNLQNGKLSLYETATMDAIYKEWKMVAWIEMPKPWSGYAR